MANNAKSEDTGCRCVTRLGFVGTSPVLHIFYVMRHRMGRQLARETPVDADLVIPVPDSGAPAAEGFAAELGITFGTGLIKNRYVARTFIQPTQELRSMGRRWPW